MTEEPSAVEEGLCSIKFLSEWDCGFESRRGMDFRLVWMLCAVQVAASATGRSLVQRNPTVYVCVCHWVRSGSTETLYTYTEQEEVLTKEKKKESQFRNIFVQVNVYLSQ